LGFLTEATPASAFHGSSADARSEE
jgi:hypothetical protein